MTKVSKYRHVVLAVRRSTARSAAVSGRWRGPTGTLSQYATRGARSQRRRNGAADGSAGLAGHESSLRRGVAVRLQRLAEEASAVFVTLGPVPLAALRLSFRPGRIEAVRGPFGPLLPPVRPIWVRVGKRGGVEIPLLCPMSAPWGPEPARDRKGPAT